MQVNIVNATGSLPRESRSIRVRDILILDVQQICAKAAVDTVGILHRNAHGGTQRDADQLDHHRALWFFRK